MSPDLTGDHCKLNKNVSSVHLPLNDKGKICSVMNIKKR